MSAAEPVTPEQAPTPAPAAPAPLVGDEVAYGAVIGTVLAIVFLLLGPELVVHTLAALPDAFRAFFGVLREAAR